MSHWVKVTFRIYGLLGKDARWAVGDYVRLAWAIVNEKLSTEKIIERLLQIGSDFAINDAVGSLSNATVYSNWSNEEIRYFFQKYEEHLARKAGQRFDNAQWNRIWEDDAARSIEHIKPQSSYGDAGEMSGWGRMHRLGNLTLLPPGLNS